MRVVYIKQKIWIFHIYGVLNFIQELRARIVLVKLCDLSDSRKEVNEGRQHLRTDNFSDIWNKFIKNSQHCYKPGVHVTIDEQIFSTKAKCRFMQYMQNKPDKYGINACLVSDVTTKFLMNGFPYLRKVKNENFQFRLKSSLFSN